MRRLLALAALSLSIALLAWLAFGQRSRPAPATMTDALVPRTELQGAGPAPRPAELLAPTELAAVERPRKRVEAQAHVDAHAGPLSVDEQLQALDQKIAEVRAELDSLQEVRVSTGVWRAYVASSHAHSERTHEIAMALQAAGRTVDGSLAAGADDPALIVVHRARGDASSPFVIPRGEFPELYDERAKLRRFEELTGIHTNRKKSATQMQLSALLDLRTSVASIAR
jgi:hypothetical protein